MVNARPATSAAGDEQQSPKSSSGAGAFFKATAFIGGAAVVGGLAWAYYNPDMRKKLEAAVPQSKPVLDTIYGAIGQQQQQPKTQTFTEKPRPKPVPPQLPVDESAKLKLTTIAELSPQPSAIPTTQKEAKLIEIMPVDVHTEGPKIEIKPMKKEPTGVLDKEYESQLTTALGEAGKKADTAKEAKFRTIQALKRHSEALKAAVDSGVRKDDDAGGTLWEKVKTAQREADGCAEQDRAEEGAARGAIDKLEKLISEGKQQRGKDAPSLVSNAQQMAAKLRDRLDELNLMLGREQAQSRIFTNYRQLVEEGRRQWADELRSVFPDIDLRAKQGSLTQEELDAFIVHANLRIDQLKRQLAEHQAQEEQRVADAVDEQRQLDEGLARVALEFERRRVRNDTGLDLDARVAQERQLWEAELEAQLKRAALAHAEHLERVIKTQKQIHDVENTQLVKEAVKIEQYKHAKQIEAAVTKLNAIEEALNSRAAQDLTNRRAKIYWTICQTLLDTLVNGDAAMKNGELAYSTKPLKEVSFIKELIDQDTFAQSLCHCFPERALEQGVPTELGLKRRYNKVHKLARRTAQIDENGGGPLKYLASWLQSLVMLRMPVVSSADEHINLNIYEPYDLLGRVQQFVDQGDLINAIRVANLLRGEPARIFRDWLADARFHLEVRYLVELLFANAQASGIRTTY